MKNLTIHLISLALAAGSVASGQTYTNYIRQTQMPAGVTWDASSTVAATGTDLSALAINPGGARFDLWTIRAAPDAAEFLLDTRYVSSYIPVAEVTITSEDPYSITPRTRADRPFTVSITVNGLLNGETDPEPSKSVSLLHHVQSYGIDGTAANIDRDQAILFDQSSIDSNGLLTLDFVVSQVPGANRAEIRGEERFSVFSLEDYQAPASQLASKTIEVWPVADGTISGIAPNQLIRYEMPQLTISVNDLYPESTTYVQAYEGESQLGVTGKIIPGSAVTVNNAGPENKVLVVDDYDSVFDKDGIWTIEVVTVTPFGVDRMHSITFELDRTIEVNGTVTTIE